MDKFTSKHLGIFIVATTVVSLKTYPTVYTRNGMRESWIAMILASILILLYLIYIIKICKNHNNYNLYQIYCTALGKGLGKFFIVLFLFSLFITLIEAAAVEANAMHTNMLVETPVWYFLIFFIFPTLYTVKKGLVPIIIVTLIGIALVTISGINLAILTAKEKHIAYLLPIFEQGLTKGFLLCILQILGLYGSVTIVFPYLTEIKDNRKLLKYSALGLLFVIQMQLVSLTGLIQTFDIEIINEMVYPNLLQTQLVTYFRYLEAGELFVMLQVIGGWYLKYVITFYALLIILEDMGIRKKWVPYFITVVVGLCAYLTANNLFVLFRLLDYYTYFSLVSFVIIPVFIFTVFDAKKRRHKSCLLL
ncbi:GerAB/ArcD/ProY family transporter [Clostridium formicaceticum]|uniref:Spore germination protein n=1 Tax=Clostridium formicaceticum TaxID=1497 RepID=A0AAC9RQ55_9CLOT|nr:endospore germination permease [Clostridium formicaceticum]AOY75171.1 spore gernimation protein [Clostridium formicaceticum]ARE89597.1 Spore germination protein [Clostridium formicaceticum]